MYYYGCLVTSYIIHDPHKESTKHVSRQSDDLLPISKVNKIIQDRPAQFLRS
jgi:hypothetical protein